MTRLSIEQKQLLIQLEKRNLWDRMPESFLDDLEMGPPPIWTPYPNSPQSRALESSADITGFGGAAGGGKSELLLGLAATQHRRSIIFRREYSQLKGLLDRAQELFYGHGKFNGQDLAWRDLPGDRKIEFGAVQHLGDERKHQGRPHDGVFFDELTHFHEYQVWFLAGWLRSVIPGQRCRIVATFNPPTSARERWVFDFFAPWLDRKHSRPAMPGELRWYARVKGESVERPDGTPFEHEGQTITPLSRTFFPARLADNPRLAATSYGAQLQSLPEPLRSQLAYGDFDAGVEDDPWQLIPTRWVDAAMARWQDRKPEGKMTILGMDVAHGGKDKTVLAPRFGDYFAALHKHPGSSTPDGRSAAALVARVVEKDTPINVDAIGYGASAAERLRDAPPEGHGLKATAVNVAAKSTYRDRSGRYKMINIRAEMYWRLREALDPEFGSTLALPPDPELLADLTAPSYEITPSGIKIESKDDIKERLSGRSPDCGDAVALSMLDHSPMRFL
jgi:hypothetical protein